jgi:hypothetical protein
MEIKIKPGALVVGLGLAGLWATKPSQASFQSYFQSWLKEQIGTAKKSEKKYVGGGWVGYRLWGFTSDISSAHVQTTSPEVDFLPAWHQKQKT